MRRVNGRDSQGSPPWVWAMLVALALVTLTAGAIVGMVTTDERGAPAAASESQGQEAGGSPPPVGSSAPEAPTDVLPPTVSIPPITDIPGDTGFTGTLPGATDTVPTTTVPTTVPAAGSWPAGRSGWTVILASVAEAQGRADADAIAARASAAGLPSVGVLRSSDYSSLRPGFWAVYSGVYDTDAQARAALPQAQAAGFAGAYPRRVAA